MPPILHSNVGASGAHRWVPCPGSIQASERFKKQHPDFEDGSVAADEGTLAHELCEIVLNDHDLPYVDGTDWFMPRLRECHVWKDEYEELFDYNEMLYHALNYREYCLDLADDSFTDSNANEQIFVEAELQMPEISPRAFGTNDFSIIQLKKRHAKVVDYKYGKGVLVDPVENYQGMQYSEGVRQKVLDEYGVELKTFEIHIYQPRSKDGANITSWEFDATRLKRFVKKARKAAKKSELPNPPFKAGPKQCSFCIAKGDCTTLRDYMHETLKDEFEDLDDTEDLKETIASNVDGMTDKDVALWMSRAPLMSSWIDALKKVAHSRMMSGSAVPGYKLVRGRNSYKPNEDMIEVLYGDEALKPKQYRSKSDMNSKFGKKHAKLVDACFETVPGQPTVAAASSKLQEWNPGEEFSKALEDEGL